MISSQVVNSSVLLLPEAEVLLEQLDDGLGVSESVLSAVVQFVERILQSSLSELASLLDVAHHFVVEDGEVQSESEPDGVASLQGSDGDVLGLLVALESLDLAFLELGALGVFGDVAAVVSDHLEEESLGLIVGSSSENVGLDHGDDVVAVSEEVSLDFGLVGGKGCGVLLVLLVLLDGGNGSDGGSLRRDQVLEGDREQVPFVVREARSLLLYHGAQEVYHVLVPLRLFGHAGHEDVLLRLHVNLKLIINY